MAQAILSEARFTNDDAARTHLEALRWPSGPVCPHCGGVERNSPLQGKSHRPGLYFCGDCRSQFSVTVGTVFERSKIPLHKWVLATHLMCSSKKGISSHQLHRTLGVTYKTAWFMTHRIREAMSPSKSIPFGSGGGSVEADETFIGQEKNQPRKQGGGNKHKVLALVEVLALVDRNSGQSITMVVDNLRWETLRPILIDNISHEARLLRTKRRTTASRASTSPVTKP